MREARYNNDIEPPLSAMLSLMDTEKKLFHAKSNKTMTLGRTTTEMAFLDPHRDRCHNPPQYANKKYRTSRTGWE